MIEIQNVDELVPPETLALLNDEAIDAILLDIAESARSEWIRLAQEELHSTRRDYIQGIQPVRFQPGQAVITLVGVLPNLLEEGMDETDLHDTLLGPGVPVAPPGSPGKRESKDGGYYRSIPFRHAGPNSGGASGQPMGSAYQGHDVVKNAQKLGRDIYKAAKKLSPSTSDGGKMAYGGRLPAGMAPKLKPYHQTDIYSGMIREQKTYKKATQSQYITFRTIAVDSSGNPRGKSPWIRPRTPGKFFSKKVDEFVQKIAPDAFAAYVGKL